MSEENPIAWYDANAARLGAQYATPAAADTVGWLVPMLPAASGLILDVGAGTGWDAAWLAAQGYEGGGSS